MDKGAVDEAIIVSIGIGHGELDGLGKGGAPKIEAIRARQEDLTGRTGNLPGRTGFGRFDREDLVGRHRERRHGECEAIRQEHGLTYFAAIPSTLYGPEDHFDPAHAHVASALLVRMHEAKQQNLPALSVWGTGNPRRDFLFSRDLADACFFLAETYEDALPINVGPDADLSIAEVAETVKQIVGYTGKLEFDATKPDGAPLKRLDASRLCAMGWKPRVDFAEGLRETYAAFLSR